MPMDPDVRLLRIERLTSRHLGQDSVLTKDAARWEAMCKTGTCGVGALGRALLAGENSLGWKLSRVSTRAGHIWLVCRVRNALLEWFTGASVAYGDWVQSRRLAGQACSAREGDSRARWSDNESNQPANITLGWRLSACVQWLAAVGERFAAWPGVRSVKVNVECQGLSRCNFLPNTETARTSD